MRLTRRATPASNRSLTSCTHPRGWDRNAKGNLVLVRNRFLLTVFEDLYRPGCFVWSRRAGLGASKAEYGSGSYATEDAAMSAAEAAAV